MKQYLLYSLLLLTNICFAQNTKPVKQTAYFPPANNWLHKSPAELGLQSLAIDAAIAAAIANETKAPRNMEVNHYHTFGKEPFGEGIGPFAERGQPTGVIVYKGYLIASWGEPSRCDMTHSVTKSFLSTVIGVAVDSGLIKNVYDTVAAYIPPIELYGQPVNRSTGLRILSASHNCWICLPLLITAPLPGMIC